MKSHRVSIGWKIILIVAVSVAVFLAALVGLSYLCLFESLRNDTMNIRKDMAGLMAISIADTIDSQAVLTKLSVPEDAMQTAQKSIAVFSKLLEGHEIGKTSKVGLIDDRGYLIFYPGVKPFSNKFCEYSELKKLLSDARGYSFIDTAYMGKGKTAVAFSPVTSPALLENNTKLYVIVSEDSGELFSPLNRLATKMGIASFILALIVLIATWAIFKGLFVDPVRKLIDGMQRLGDGKFDYRIDVKTGDEFEELAAGLNNASESLSHITTSIKMLDKEKSERKITQQRFEEEHKGFLALMVQVHKVLFDITKGTDSVRQEAVGRAGNIIKNLEKDIYAAKLETGGIEFKLEPKDLRDIIKESVFSFEPKVREKGLDLRLDIPKASLSIRADKDKLRQALDILLQNSLIATEKGYVAISVKQSKNEVECSISDTGMSIPKGSIHNVFERFNGFSRTPSPGGAWADPDLYIAKSIIEKHDGKIRVESEPGNRTIFTFSLPSSSAILK